MRSGKRGKAFKVYQEVEFLLGDEFKVQIEFMPDSKRTVLIASKKVNGIEKGIARFTDDIDPAVFCDRVFKVFDKAEKAGI